MDIEAKNDRPPAPRNSSPIPEEGSSENHTNQPDATPQEARECGSCWTRGCYPKSPPSSIRERGEGRAIPAHPPSDFFHEGVELITVRGRRLGLKPALLHRHRSLPRSVQRWTTPPSKLRAARPAVDGHQYWGPPGNRRGVSLCEDQGGVARPRLIATLPRPKRRSSTRSHLPARRSSVGAHGHRSVRVGATPDGGAGLRGA